MVSIDDLNDAYKRINPYIVKTPIHILSLYTHLTLPTIYSV